MEYVGPLCSALCIEPTGLEEASQGEKRLRIKSPGTG